MVYPVKHVYEYEIYKNIENPARTYTQYREAFRIYKVSKSFNSDKYHDKLVKIAMTPVKEYSQWVSIEWRICVICKEFKWWDQFYKARCKSCRNKIRKERNRSKTSRESN